MRCFSLLFKIYFTARKVNNNLVSELKSTKTENQSLLSPLTRFEAIPIPTVMNNMISVITSIRCKFLLTNIK